MMITVRRRIGNELFQKSAIFFSERFPELENPVDPEPFGGYAEDPSEPQKSKSFEKAWRMNRRQATPLSSREAQRDVILPLDFASRREDASWIVTPPLNPAITC